MNTHAQELVKVNAWVDKGIACVVRALSEIVYITTLHSCESYQDVDGASYGYVQFTCGNGNATGKILHDLTGICRQLSVVCAEVHSFRVVLHFNRLQFHAKMTFALQDAQIVAELLRNNYFKWHEDTEE